MTTDSSRNDVPTPRSRWVIGVIVFAFSLHLMVGYGVLVSGLVFPIPVVGALLVLWFAGLIVMVRWRSNPGRVLAVPLILVAILYAAGLVGDAVFGWTA